MSETPIFATQASISTFAAAVLATVIAVGILSAVAIMFQRDGKPLQRVAAAARACVHHNYQSERQACMKEWLAGSQSGIVARR